MQVWGALLAALACDVWSALYDCPHAREVHLGRPPRSPFMRAVGKRAGSYGRAPPRMRCEPVAPRSLPRFYRYVGSGIRQRGGACFWRAGADGRRLGAGPTDRLCIKRLGIRRCLKPKATYVPCRSPSPRNCPPEAHRMARPRSTTNGDCVPWGRFTINAKLSGISYQRANPPPPPN